MTAIQTGAEAKTLYSQSDNFESMVRAGSAKLAQAIKAHRGWSFPCGHQRSAGNTQWFRGESRCKQCRRREVIKLVYSWPAQPKPKPVPQAKPKKGRPSASDIAERRRKREGERRLLAAQMREKADDAARPTLDAIKATICWHFNISPHDLLGNRRFLDLIHARAVLYRVLRDRGHSYPVIGRIAGGRDHSTVLNSIQLFDYYRGVDPRVGETYKILKDAPDACRGDLGAA